LIRLPANVGGKAGSRIKQRSFMRFMTFIPS
jgi:hypothetical protein